MNPLAIAVQGIGFAAALVAVQGFAPEAVVTPVNPPAAASYNTTVPQKPARFYDWIERKAAQATVKKVVVKAKVNVPVPAASAVAEPEKARVQTLVTVPRPSAQATASLTGSRACTKLGQITASGEHDLIDEDILLMVLALLDQTMLV
jgi:hypothetical protein